MRGFHCKRISVVSGSKTPFAMSMPQRVDRRAEVEPQHLASRGALHPRVFGGDAVAGGQAAIVHLEDEVAAAVLIRHHRAGDMEAPMLVGGGEQTARTHHANPGRPFSPASW
jgi:hypothetical protein